MIGNIEHFYKPGIVIMRNDPIKNGIGGRKDYFEPHLDISGLIRPLSGSEVQAADKLTLKANYRMYCGVVDIKETDKVYWEDKEYDVIFVSNPMDMDNHLQVDLLLVK